MDRSERIAGNRFLTNRARTGVFPVMETLIPFEMESNTSRRKFRLNLGMSTLQWDENTNYRERVSIADSERLSDRVGSCSEKEVWRVRYDKGGSGGTLTTRVTLSCRVRAIRLFRFIAPIGRSENCGQGCSDVPMAGPMTYMVDGQQYIAVSAAALAST